MVNNYTQACETLLALLDQLKCVMSHNAEMYGLTAPQLYALYAISQEGKTTMGHVAGQLHCDASNITGIVDRLVAQQLVVRKEDERDRRAKVLGLTAKGHHVIASIVEALPAHLGFDRLSPSEADALGTLLAKLGAS